MRIAATLSLALLAAACSGGSDAGNGMGNAAANETAAANAPIPLRKGWADIFSKGEESADAFRRVSLRNGAYKAEGSIYRSTGLPNPMSDSEATHPNIGLFEVQGDKDALDRVIFTLEIADLAHAEEAKGRFANQFDLVFQQVGIAGAKEVREAILKEQAAKGTVDGADYTVVREPLPAFGANARRIVVTFYRPGSSPAAIASPRNA